MQIDDVIRKINKLLAIAADPSASDQEIQLATYRAEKLMLKYKIENKDIINERNSNKELLKCILLIAILDILFGHLTTLQSIVKLKLFIMEKLIQQLN